MKNITNKSIEKDLNLLKELDRKYREAIWEGKEGQRAHFDNQQKMVKIAMSDVRVGLGVAFKALLILNDIGVEED